MLQLKKQQWLRWKASPHDLALRDEYTRVKLLASRKAETRNQWWGERAEEAEQMYEMAVRNGWGGSLLRLLRSLVASQQVRLGTALRVLPSLLDHLHPQPVSLGMDRDPVGVVEEFQ